MMEQEQIQQAAEKLLEERKKKKRKKALIAVVILLLVAAAIVAYLLTRKPKDVITEENYQQIKEEADAEVREGYFETYMNSEWTFPDGTSKTTDAVLGNSPNNTKPIRCEVTLADTGKKIFSTDVMPVGSELPPFKLDVDLEAGTYEAICRVYLLNKEEDGTYTDYSDAGFNVTITVEN